jgi:hypothetical protein
LAAAASCAANVRAATARMLEGADGQVADLKDEAAASAFSTAPGRSITRGDYLSCAIQAS